MWSLVVGALAGVLGMPSDPVASYQPSEPFSCVVPAGGVQPDPCAGLDRRSGMSCVIPVLFRGSLVTCPPGPRPEGRTLPLGR